MQYYHGMVGRGKDIAEMHASPVGVAKESPSPPQDRGYFNLSHQSRVLWLF